MMLLSFCSFAQILGFTLHKGFLVLCCHCHFPFHSDLISYLINYRIRMDINPVLICVVILKFRGSLAYTSGIQLIMYVFHEKAQSLRMATRRTDCLSCFLQRASHGMGRSLLPCVQTVAVLLQIHPRQTKSR